MNYSGNKSLAAAELRQKAAELLKRKSSYPGSGNIEAGTFELIHELELYQAELEIQNEALITAKEQAELATKKYTELYDFAPSAYFTITRDGKIVELNFRGSQMLGIEREKLTGSQFGFFVSNNTKALFNRFLSEIFNKKTSESCEVMLFVNGKPPIHVHMSGIVAENGAQCLLTVVDITRINLVNEEVLKSEQRYQTLAKIAPVGIFHTDASGYTTYVNPGWCQITGLSADAGLGNNWLDAVHEADKKKLFKEWNEAVTTQESSLSEYRFIRPDGSIAWVMGQAIPEKNQDNRVLGYVGTITDITERKYAEQEIEKEHQVNESMINSTSDLMWSVSKDFNLIASNSAFLNYLEDKYGLLLKPGDSLMSVQHFTNDYLQFWKDLYTMGLSGETLFTEVAGIQTSETSWFEINIHPIYFGNEITGVSCFGRDITERKQKEEALASMDELYRRTCEIARVGGWELDLRTMKRFWSEETCRILEIDPPVTPALSEEINFSFYAPEALPLVESAVKNGIENGTPFDLELPMITAKGRPIWVRDQGTFVKLDGKVIMVQGVFQDITGRRQAEKELQESESFLKETQLIANIGTYNLDITTGKWTSSEVLDTIFGIDADFERTFENWPTIIHPDWRKRMVDYFIEEVIGNKNQFNIEYKIIRINDKATRWVHGIGNLKLDENNQPITMVGTIRDITERKLIEIELIKAKERAEESERFLKETQLIASLGTYTLDFSAGTWASSEVLDTILGIDTDFDRTFKNWPAIVHPDWRNMMEEYYRAEIAGNKADFDKEFKIIRANDKAVRWIHALGSLKLNDQNQPMFLVGTAWDITERKEAGEELLKSKQQFQNLVENISGVYWVNNLDTYQTMYISPSYETIWGRKCGDLYKNPSDFINAVHPDDKQLISEAHKNIADTSAMNLPFRIVRPDGEIRWMSVKTNVVINPDGSKTEYGYAEDITEQKKAEEAIKQSNERFELIAKATNDGLWDWNLETNMVWANEIHQQLYRLSLADPVPDYEEWMRRIHPEDRERTVRALEDAKASKQTNYVDEYRFYTEKTGWVNVHGRTLIVYNKEGNPVRLIGSMINNTEQKKAEEEIKNTTEQLRQLTNHLQGIREEERKRIGREIHDELGQQLTAIKMDVVWIDKKTPVETTIIKNKLKNIIALLDGSNQSVRRILSELRPDVLDEHSLLDALEWMGSQFTVNTGIPTKLSTTETEIKSSAPVAACIFRVCQEAFTNITRYAQAKKVSTSISIADKNIVVIIKDNGIGFDTEFTQNKKSFGILGMKERVHSLNGKFEIISSPGKGTKIMMTLPYSS